MERRFDVVLRRDTRGGLMVRELLGTQKAFVPRSRVVLLVHGYNVSEPEAHAEYDDFAAGLTDLAPQLSGQVGRLLWPGDSGVPLLRPLAYPWRVASAVDCASDLARYIHERDTPEGRPAAVVLIAHSLGVRLVIEAMARLAELEPVETRPVTLVLMAAAVAVDTARDRVWPYVARSPRFQTVVLFSEFDKVLRFAFPIGQLLAEPRAFQLQEAVGLHGRPLHGVWTSRERMARYDHGDYWRSTIVRRLICALLGFAVRIFPSEHVVESRGLPGRQSLLSRRLVYRKLEIGDRH